jgi:hypothetical protein
MPGEPAAAARDYDERWKKAGERGRSPVSVSIRSAWAIRNMICFELGDGCMAEGRAPCIPT